MLGITFYMDEITMHFKGRHADKIRITYKVWGDGLHIYHIFQKGYTYQIFICNDHVSKTYLAKRLFPVDARVMDIFDTEEGRKLSMRDG